MSDSRTNARTWLCKDVQEIQGPIKDEDEKSLARQMQEILRRAINGSASLSQGQEVFVAAYLQDLLESALSSEVPPNFNLDLLPLATYINSCHE